MWRILLCFLILVSYAQAEDYTISFSTDTEQEGILTVLIHQECARLLASGQNIQTYCTQNAPPNDQFCTCTPTSNQRRTFVVQRYLNRGFVVDKQELYRNYGRELGVLYSGGSKAARDACDNAFGRPVLP